MSEVIFATVENGLVRPDREVALSTGTKVRLTVEPADEPEVRVPAACEALNELCDELPIDSHGSRLTRDQRHDRR